MLKGSLWCHISKGLEIYRQLPCNSYLYIAELEFGISGFCSVLDACVEIASRIKFISIIVGISFIKIFGNLENLKRKKKM